MEITEFTVKETSVRIISSEKEQASHAIGEIIEQRRSLEKYIAENPAFLYSMEPMEIQESAPEIIRKMSEASWMAGVGPMASVAGAIAELACRKMHERGSGVCLVENGGDMFTMTDTPLKIALYAGRESPANNLCISINPRDTPLSICSSSSFLGHSISFGQCDLATVFSRSGFVADAFATALCNSIKSESDMKGAVEWICSHPEVRGAIAVKGKNIALCGHIGKILRHEADVEGRITFHPRSSFARKLMV